MSCVMPRGAARQHEGQGHPEEEPPEEAVEPEAREHVGGGDEAQRDAQAEDAEHGAHVGRHGDLVDLLELRDDLVEADGNLEL